MHGTEVEWKNAAHRETIQPGQEGLHEELLAGRRQVRSQRRPDDHAVLHEPQSNVP